MLSSPNPELWETYEAALSAMRMAELLGDRDAQLDWLVTCCDLLVKIATDGAWRA